MNKPYHLTQEQALEILNAIPSNLSPEIRATKFANAALDKVLGEPVLYMAKSLENGTYATHPRKTECELFLLQSKLINDGKQAIVTPLYAPKELA